MKYKIQNIVATANAAETIDLDLFAKLYEDCKYEPEKFPGLVLKLKNPKSSALIFPNGKVVVTGTSSIENLEKAVEMVEQRIFWSKHS